MLMASNADEIVEDLAAEWGHLVRTWEEARSVWRDQVAVRFERDVWRPVEAEVLSFLRNARDVCAVISDCEA